MTNRLCDLGWNIFTSNIIFVSFFKNTKPVAPRLMIYFCFVLLFWFCYTYICNIVCKHEYLTTMIPSVIGVGKEGRGVHSSRNCVIILLSKVEAWVWKRSWAGVLIYLNNYSKPRPTSILGNASQCSTSVTKAVVCAILSVEWCI